MKSENSTVAYYGSRAVSLWNSMLLFTSPPVAIMSRTQAFHDTSKLAGGPFRYNRHKWQWSKQLLFSFSCSEVNGNATAPNDKAHKGGETFMRKHYLILFPLAIRLLSIWSLNILETSLFSNKEPGSSLDRRRLECMRKVRFSSL